MRTLRYAAFPLLAFVIPAILAADPIVIDFEGPPDSTILTNQYSGVTFSNAIVLTAGIGLNEFEFPPHSGINIASDNGGAMTVSFSSAAQSFGGYFTYAEPLTLKAFGITNNLLGSVTSLFSNNEAFSGVSGSSPNEFLQFSSWGGISFITITGDPAGGSFALDDASYTSPSSGVPELGTFFLLLGGTAFLGLSRLRPCSRVLGRSRPAQLAALLALLILNSAYAAPTITGVNAAPTTIPLGANIAVTFTATISDPSVIAQSIVLIQYDQAGNPLQVLGQLHDDGINGDATAGDNIYSFETAVPDGSPGVLNARVSAAFRGLVRRVISSPLSVTVKQNQIVTDQTTQVIVSIPDVGVASQVTYNQPSGQAPYLDLKYSTTTASGSLSAFRVIVDTNSANLGLAAWFTQNVDPTGMLLSGGTFAQRLLANGSQAFVLVGPVPAAYQDGPVEDGYLMLSGDKRVFTVVSADDSPLYVLGYSAVQVRQLATQILQNITTP